jgi:hypothetical protein
MQSIAMIMREKMTTSTQTSIKLMLLPILLAFDIHAQEQQATPDSQTQVTDSVAATPQALPEPPPKLGDVSDGSRSVPVHLIRLYDELGMPIRPQDDLLLPFSTKQTCTPCHNYEKISTGWHFNAGDTSVAAGRVGQPWILADPVAATQIPISLREWPGTYRPEQIGMSTLEYVQTFGRHLAGGGVAEKEEAKSAEDYMRWQVAGNLEINCLGCHDAEAGQDQAEFANQIGRQNFRWAATASSGFAAVRGSAKDMPENFDMYLNSALDYVGNISPPTVSYTAERFNEKGEVLFDIRRRMPNAKCYYCHSNRNTEHERFTSDEDVHMAAGMLCVDCHRNGLNHMMTRGYEGEAQTKDKPELASLTCRGCHMPEESAHAPHAGRFAAPYPEHRGMPPIHFAKLTCTACHAGPWPNEQTARVQTSQAHALGTHQSKKAPASLPHLVAPVFVKESDGKFAPHRMLWPAFWAYEKNGAIVPIHPKIVRPLLTDFFIGDTLKQPGAWATLSDSVMIAMLDTLAKMDASASATVYISGGKLHRLDQSRKLVSREHAAAQPYSWTIGHDVRPAQQSLGVRGCGDCHATDAPFYFGKVETASALPTSFARMTDFQGTAAIFPWSFSMSFLFRPWLKLIIIAAGVVLAATLLLYSLQGLSRVSKVLAEE